MKIINKTIQMICTTFADGKIEPMKFKILCKDNTSQVYDVLKVYTIEDLKLSGVKTRRFECDININGNIKRCELKYDLDSCRWTLFKI